jgi:hypothetical protein
VGLPEGYQRKCHVATLSIDHDAWAMLLDVAPTYKAYGRYLSELIRRDYVMRQQWEQLRALQQNALVEVGALE